MCGCSAAPGNAPILQVQDNAHHTVRQHVKTSTMSVWSTAAAFLRHEAVCPHLPGPCTPGGRH